MKFFFCLFRPPRGNPVAGRRSPAAENWWRPVLEGLEVRALPSTLSVITSNFNGTAIPSGSSIWFSSVLKATGPTSSPFTVRMLASTITFAANNVNYHLSVPNAAVTFSPTATTATTTFDSSSNTWVTTVPTNHSGNAFLDGFTFAVTSNLPGGINPVNWQGSFESDTSRVSVNWQWAAGVYTQFGTSYNALGVKPVDDDQLSVYGNSDHAGTPENFKAYVTGGARGGGGSNWTGSLSPTVTVQPSLPPAPSSLTGSVVVEGTNAGLANVVVTLTGTNDLGQAVSQSTTTSTTGAYGFTGLRPGTYTLTETPPAGYTDAQNTVGSLGGTASGNQIAGIVLNPGVNGVGYTFGDLFSGSGGGTGGS